MPERPTPRTARHAATRARILEEAWALGRESGLAGISLRDLAARVGMRAPSLYSYFPSKSAIYDAMFADANRALLALIEPVAADESLDARARVHLGARTWMDFCCADPVRFALLYQRTVPGFEPSPESYALALRIVELLTTGLRESGRTDQRDLDLHTAYLSGLAAQQIANDPGGDRWSRLLDDTVALLLDGVPEGTR